MSACFYTSFITKDDRSRRRLFLRRKWKLSVCGWLKMTIANAFNWLCDCFGFAFRQSFENRSIPHFWYVRQCCFTGTSRAWYVTINNEQETVRGDWDWEGCMVVVGIGGVVFFSLRKGSSRRTFTFYIPFWNQPLPKYIYLYNTPWE